MSSKWRIEISFPGYQETIQQLKKSDPQLTYRLQVAGQNIRQFCKEGYSPNDKRFGAPLGRGFYKFRIPGPRTGKTGGYRLIYAILWERKLIIPMFIYRKSHKNDLTKKQYEDLLRKLIDFLESEK